MTARAEAAAATAERILDAVEALFHEEPARDSTLDEIAARAGVSVQTVIRRFGGRDGVFAAAARARTEDVEAHRDTAPVGDVAGAVAVLARPLRGSRRPTCACSPTSTRNPRLAEIVENGRRSHVAWCERVFAPTLAGLRGDGTRGPPRPARRGLRRLHVEGAAPRPRPHRQPRRGARCARCSNPSPRSPDGPHPRLHHARARAPVPGHADPRGAALARGHEISVRTLGSEVELARSLGFATEPIDPAVEAVEHDDFRARTPMGALKRGLSVFTRRAPLDAADLRRALEEERPDALIVDVNAWGALAVAEASGGPWAVLVPLPAAAPVARRAAVRPGFAPARGPLGRLRDRVLSPLIVGGHERLVLPPVNAIRAEQGLAPLAGTGELFASAPLTLYMTAEPFEYPRSDWPTGSAWSGRAPGTRRPTRRPGWRGSIARSCSSRPRRSSRTTAASSVPRSRRWRARTSTSSRRCPLRSPRASRCRPTRPRRALRAARARAASARSARSPTAAWGRRRRRCSTASPCASCRSGATSSRWPAASRSPAPGPGSRCACAPIGCGRPCARRWRAAGGAARRRGLRRHGRAAAAADAFEALGAGNTLRRPCHDQVYLQRDQPDGVPPLALTGERTLPDVPEENYWYRRHLVVYEWIAARVGGLQVVDMACGRGLRRRRAGRTRRARSSGVDAEPRGARARRARYPPALRFERDLVETFAEPCDAIVFLQTIEHVARPRTRCSSTSRRCCGRAAAYVSTPNLLTLAPEGAEKSENPWHVKEYRAEEFRALCEAHFSYVELLGLFHARKLRVARARASTTRAGTTSTRGSASPSRSTTASRRRSASRDFALRPAGARRGAGLRRRLPAVKGTRPPRDRPAHPHAVRGGLRHVALRRGVAVGGDRDVATCRSLDVLDDTGAAMTLSVTPVLADQLAAPGAGRALPGLPARRARAESHRLDVAEQPAELRRRATRARRRATTSAPPRAASTACLEGAARPRTRRGPRRRTHAVLPLRAPPTPACGSSSSPASRRHRARFGRAGGGGLWLPECAHAPWLDPLLEDAGVHATCVDLTDVFGLGAREHLRPLRTEAGPLLVPIDRQIIELVWSDRRLPGRRRLPRLPPPHAARPPPVGGRRLALRRRTAPARAGARARRRLRRAGAVPRPDGAGGLVVCALDTELLGHWWYEGPQWLRAVVDGVRRPGSGARATSTTRSRGRRARRRSPTPAGHDLGPAPRPVDVGRPGRRGLRLARRAAPSSSVLSRPAATPTPRAVRELLALQSSDWAFLVHRDARGRLRPTERADGPPRAPARPSSRR